MPVVLRHNETFELNLAEYSGSVTLAELETVASYLGQNPAFLKRDCLSLVLPNTDFDSVPIEALDQLFGRYKTYYQPINFQIIRRSAWLCLSPAAQAHVDHWSGNRDARETMSTMLRQFSSFEDAGEWLVLSEVETKALETNAGFVEIIRFVDNAHALRTGTR